MAKHRVLILLLATLIGGCEPTPEQKEERAWFSTIASRTEQGYHDYLAAWPDTNRAEDTKRHLENLAWREAAWRHTAESYRAFLGKWPDSTFSSLAEDALVWKSETNLYRDTNVTLSLILRIVPDPGQREGSETEKLAETVLRLLECAGYEVNSFSSDGNEYRSALLDIQINMRPIERKYSFDGSQHTVASGTELSGSVQWTSSDGRSAGPKQFSEVDPPPDGLFMSKKKLEKSISAAQLRSMSRIMEARHSFWDRLASIVLENAGPQAYLCPTHILSGGVHWVRAREDTSMPMVGATVAALFSKVRSKSRKALEILLRSEAPHIERYLERYLDAYRVELGSDNVQAVEKFIASKR